MKRQPITPGRLEEAIANYVVLVKGDPSARSQIKYVEQLRSAFDAVEHYHRSNPGRRDLEHDYILCAKAVKDAIDKDYARKERR